MYLRDQLVQLLKVCSLEGRINIVLDDLIIFYNIEKRIIAL
jgi:hypothetical protein